MIRLADGMSYVDLEFSGRSRVIATAVLHGTSGVALVDPGPASTLPALRRKLSDAGIALADVGTILLTHIHLDHAAACGALVAEFPKLRIYVHEKGAPHMADPAKLLASAARLYGAENMVPLWGDVLPVPEASLTALRGGEAIVAGGHRFTVEYTPGHASHHVSYFNQDSGIAFVGDTAGLRLSQAGRVVPPTPPPDIDLDAWEASLKVIEGHHPSTLFLTHFGPSMSVRSHLAELRDQLRRVASLSRGLLETDSTDEERERQFVEEIRRDLRRHTGSATLEAYEAAGRLDLNWRGLARYWRKKQQAA